MAVSVGGLRLDEAEVRGLGPHAVAALAIGAWHCAAKLTDGVLTPQAISGLGIGYAARKKLVDAGLWKERDGGAIEVVDYLEHNPSRADVEARREKASQRMKRVRSHVRSNSIPESPPVRANTPANDTPNERANGELPPSDSPSDPYPSGSSPGLLQSSSALSSDPKDGSGSARVSRKKPKVPLPAGWEPRLRHVEKASERRLNFSLEVDRFKADADKHSRRYADWDRAFDSWLISPYAKPESQPMNGRGTRAGDLVEDLFSEANRLRAEGQ